MMKLLAMIFMTIVISHVAELKVPSKKKMWKEILKLKGNVEENEEAIDDTEDNVEENKDAIVNLDGRVAIIEAKLEKILVANGYIEGCYDEACQLEFFNMASSSACPANECQLEIPKLESPIGGFIGCEAVICGGRKLSDHYFSDHCRVLRTGKTFQMQTSRFAPSSAVFNDSLLVTGGWSNSSEYLMSSEWITLDEPHSIDAGNMPIGLHSHSMEIVTIGSSSYAIVMGGTSENATSTNGTFYGKIVDSQTPIQWKEGPELPEPIRAHQQSAVLHSDSKTYVIVSYGWKSVFMEVTANPDHWKWTSAPQFGISGISLFGMVSLGNRIVAFGGWNGYYNNIIHVLECISCEWKVLNGTLQYARDRYAAFQVPSDWSLC